MATTSHILESADKELHLPQDSNDPAHVVRGLLANGKIDEARAELSRLLLEGIDSGPGIPATSEFWDELMAEARGATDARQ